MTLSPLEVGSELVMGLVDEPPLPAATNDPRAALEQAILPALRRPPCLVSFSGGRDSSAVLAVATDVARRQGLPPPVPATNRFRNAPASDEAVWQEDVIRHLRLDEWVRLEWDDELDCVGPVATAVLERHGLVWPFNAHFHVPLLREAAGGSLLTGIGGDEVLGESPLTRVRAVLGARVRPEPRDALRLGYALAPRPLRRAYLRRTFPPTFAWLHAAARRTVVAGWARQTGSEPLRRRDALTWRLSFRYLAVGRATLAALAADEQVAIVHPLLDPSFVAALAALPSQVADGGRTALVDALFSDLLPRKLLLRETKSHFNEAFWTRTSAAFAERWSGRGVDVDVVDERALRREWASELPDPRTFTLVQAAWLAERATQLATASSSRSDAGRSELQSRGRDSLTAGSDASSSSRSGRRGGSRTAA